MAQRFTGSREQEGLSSLVFHHLTDWDTSVWIQKEGRCSLHPERGQARRNRERPGAITGQGGDPGDPGNGERWPIEKSQRSQALGLDTAPTSSRRDDWRVSKQPSFHRCTVGMTMKAAAPKPGCPMRTQHRVGSEKAGAQIVAETHDNDRGAGGT